MSLCLQGALIDLAESGRLTVDWIGIMDEYLMEYGLPLAYSKRYSERLFGFGQQYRQATVQSIHTRWWIECCIPDARVDHAKYADLLWRTKVSPEGLLYDHDISPTILRHRMKTELTMSAALGVELLGAAGQLDDKRRAQLATNLVEPRKCPPTGYMGTEYFRFKALQLLGYRNLFPVNIEAAIEACATDLVVGYCDFSMNSKVDAYMGTAKRTARDKPIHSPLTACHVAELLGAVSNEEQHASIEARLADYADHLRQDPLDIPAFQMRDVAIPFGADKTPLEILCTSHLIRRYA
jgi:hypothetical protein